MEKVKGFSDIPKNVKWFLSNMDKGFAAFYCEICHDSVIEEKTAPAEKLFSFAERHCHQKGEYQIKEKPLAQDDKRPIKNKCTG